MNRDRVDPYAVALQILGVAAGVGALIALVGGAMLWIRFDALGLPADQAVALLPERLLVIVGFHSLAVPLLVALVVLLVLAAIDPLEDMTQKPKAQFWILLGLLVIGGLWLLIRQVDGLDAKYELAMYGIAIGAAVALGLGARSRHTRGRHVTMIAFAAVATCGGALAIVRTAGSPQMEPVAVLLKDGKRGVSGFFVGQTSDRFFIASLPGTGTADDPFADAPIDRLVELPRDEILRTALRRPTGLGPGDAGRDQAQTLLSDLQANSAAHPAPAPVAAERQLARAFAPLVHLHSSERYWPVSADRFIADSALYWSHRGNCPDWSVAGKRHIKKRAKRPAEVSPPVDAERLGGANPYSHPFTGPACVENPQRLATATDYTRPFGGGRPEGVPRRDGFFLDMANALRHGGGHRERNGSQVYFSGVPAYYEQHEEGENRLRITYWLFYAYSRSPGPKAVVKRLGSHEGDWERLSVLLEPVGDRYSPMSVRYHFHSESRDVPWQAIRAVGDGKTKVGKKNELAPTHPVAYVGRTSHATYPRAGDYEQTRVVGGHRVSAVDRAIACPNCPQWRTWEALCDAQRQPWYGFGGAWGVVRSSSERSGPLGPTPRKSLSFQPTAEQERRARSKARTGTCLRPER